MIINYQNYQNTYILCSDGVPFWFQIYFNYIVKKCVYCCLNIRIRLAFELIDGIIKNLFIKDIVNLFIFINVLKFSQFLCILQMIYF